MPERVAYFRKLKFDATEGRAEIQAIQNSGVSRRGARRTRPPPPWFWTKLRPEVPKKCLLRPPPPSPRPYLSVWMTAATPYLKSGSAIAKIRKISLSISKIKAESIPRILKIIRLCYEMSRSFPIHFLLGLLKYSVNVLSVERNRWIFSIFFSSWIPSQTTKLLLFEFNVYIRIKGTIDENKTFVFSLRRNDVVALHW